MEKKIMLRVYYFVITFFIAFCVNAQNINLVDINKLMLGDNLGEKDAYLSQRGFVYRKDAVGAQYYNYWNSKNTSERVFIFITNKMALSLQYFTQDPSCVTALFNDIEKSTNYSRYYPSIQNDNLIVTSYKNKANTRFITIKKNINSIEKDNGWTIDVSTNETSIIYN